MNVIKLAEITGVSKSTIYRAINGDKIKDSTKQRIMDTINENDINFSFNGFEANIDGKVKLIALITSNRYSNRAFIEQLKDRFSENGFTVIEISSESVENGSAEIEKYISKNFRSFIFLGMNMENKCSEMIQLASQNRPVVLIHSYMSGKNIYCITSDEKDAVSKAILKLSDDYGHKNFLYCISDKTESGKNISHGFEDGINLSGLGRNNFCSADCVSRSTPVVDVITSALRSNPFVTAVIAQDEATASDAAEAALRLGLKIPRDITIVGLKSSNINFEDLGTAYIDTKTDTICDMALTLTFAAINGKRASRHIKIPCTFIQKKSVAKSSVQYSKAM